MTDRSLDIRYHADERIVHEVDFTPDPLEEKTPDAATPFPRVDALESRKKPTGLKARRALAIHERTGMWVH